VSLRLRGRCKLGLSFVLVGAFALPPAVSSAQIGQSSRDSATALDEATHARVTSLAQQILNLAKTKAPHRFYNLRGAFSFSYEVAVEIRVPRQPESALLDDKYALYAHFARPPGSRKGLVDPRDFAKLKAKDALGVNINGGAEGMSFTHEALPGHAGQLALRPGWFFTAGYIDTQDHFTRLSASTRPYAPHQRRLTLPELDLAAAQAKQILTAAEHGEPTTFLPPVFPRTPHENDLEPILVF
jgi:hypothetical protein